MKATIRSMNTRAPMIPPTIAPAWLLDPVAPLRMAELAEGVESLPADVCTGSDPKVKVRGAPSELVVVNVCTPGPILTLVKVTTLDVTLPSVVDVNVAIILAVEGDREVSGKGVLDEVEGCVPNELRLESEEDVGLDGVIGKVALGEEVALPVVSGTD